MLWLRVLSNHQGEPPWGGVALASVIGHQEGSSLKYTDKSVCRKRLLGIYFAFMNYKILLFNHWLRVYQTCSKKLIQLRLAGRNKKRQGRLAMTIRRLHKKLTNLLATFQRTAITSAAVCALAFTSQTSQAQTFLPPVSNPFGIVNLDQYSIADLADMDGDGDLDIMSGVYGGDFYYYQNTGSNILAAFGDPELNPFGLISTGVYNYPTLADLDSDGDLDIMSLSYDGEFMYYENTGTATHPDFADPEPSPFELNPVGSLFFPTLVDLDNDGDFDIMAGAIFEGALVYFENTGTPTAPAFAAGQVGQFGLPVEAYITNAAIADLDIDGDLDLLTGSYGEFLYFQNIGNASTPVFDAPQSNPFNLVFEGDLQLPFFGDLDGDGDTDMMSIDNNGNTFYFENDTMVSVVPFDTGEDLGDILYPNPNPGKFKIEVSQESTLEIIDALGRIVYSKHVNNGTENIDISYLGEGLFVVKIISGERKILHQVVVVK